MTNQLLRLPQVRDKTGLARSTIYALVAKGKFPAPIKASERVSAWILSEVSEWIDQRIEASRRTYH